MLSRNSPVGLFHHLARRAQIDRFDIAKDLEMYDGSKKKFDAVKVSMIPNLIGIIR